VLLLFRPATTWPGFAIIVLGLPVYFLIRFRTNRNERSVDAVEPIQEGSSNREKTEVPHGNDNNSHSPSSSDSGVSDEQAVDASDVRIHPVAEKLNKIAPPINMGCSLSSKAVTASQAPQGGSGVKGSYAAKESRRKFGIEPSKVELELCGGGVGKWTPITEEHRL